MNTTSRPTTFTAHGHTWTSHTPGDPMPCKSGTVTAILCRNKVRHTGMAGRWSWEKIEPRDIEIIGWRYATPQPQELDELTKARKRDTPRTDDHTYGGKGVIGAGYVSADFARSLERELTSLRSRLLAIYNLTSPYADGAPDASAHDKLANEIAALAKPLGKSL